MAVRAHAMQGSWDGTASDLLTVLSAAVPEDTRKAKSWPTTPRGMSGALRRAAPGLRKLGLTLDLDKREPDKNRRRLISIGPADKGRQQSSEPSEPSESLGHRALPADGRPAATEEPSEQPSIQKQCNDGLADGSDGSDGRMHEVADQEDTWTV
jgi:hypothetical protein